ncbi:MAG: MFS transporter [Acidobacteriota bacterium]|nr:MFS transporter [Blastocatellia bacterium]MDW8411612.1 MFS transporter [Acidobacteriota bacterium]
MPLDRKAKAWALYDWANSAYATTIMAGFFPVFFKDFWSIGISPTESTFWLGVSVSTASLLVAVVAPVLGAIADGGSARKRSLLLFASVGIACTATLYFIPQGYWQAAATIYCLASIGFLAANIFYDALLVSVSTAEEIDRISSLGFALGYLGGGLLFSINLLMAHKPASVYLTSQTEAVRVSFLTVAVWWAVFTLPLAIYVPEPTRTKSISLVDAFKLGIQRLGDTIRQLTKLRGIVRFLFAYWLYIDGVHTIITMSVDYGKNIGLTTNELISGLLLVQFIGFPGTYLTGKLARRYGAKTVVMFCLSIYLFVTIIAATMDSKAYEILGLNVSKFYLLATLIGLVQGGVQALSRSMYANFIPTDKEAEFFGLYNMLGKFASIFGPLLIGATSLLSGSPRYGVLSIAALFLTGMLLLSKVRY